MFEGALWLADIDEVKVGQVGEQEQKICASLFDELPHIVGPVCSEPIEHHYLPFGKRRGQEVLSM